MLESPGSTTTTTATSTCSSSSRHDPTLGWIEAFTVENRWDHLWFLDEPGRVRFFRPTVLISYALDRAIWGDAFAFGASLTNVAIHLGCCGLVVLLFTRWLGTGAATAAAALLFAGLWSHGEAIWYIAGRTDSLAALGVLGAVWLHGCARPPLRWLGVASFAFALFTKELALATPFVLASSDLWLRTPRVPWPDRLRAEAPLYGAHVATAVGVLAVKSIAMGSSGDLVFPYFVSPLRPDFPLHLLAQLQAYLGNLLLAEFAEPFATPERVQERHGWRGLGLGIALVGVCIWRLRDDPRAWFCASFGLLFWLPTSVVYVSERYLYCHR